MKPTEQEMKVITIMLSIAFGVIIGLASTKQKVIELEEEISRLMLEKPKVELVGRYGIRFEWPTGCSSGIHSFSHLRKVSEELGKQID